MNLIPLVALFVGSLFVVKVGCSQDAIVTTDSTSLSVQSNDDGILISEDGNPVLQYQAKPKSNNGTHRRANYVHPLYDLDGNVLTEDFPRDHLHQRGIFWAWHQVTVGDKVAGDGWMTTDFDWIVKSKKSKMQTSDSVRITAEVQWRSPLIKDEFGQPLVIVNETTTIQVQRTENHQRIVDFEIRLLAAQAGVKIGGSDDVKGYGGFSARVIQPKDIAFNTAEGFVEATKTQMECGSWVDIVGTFGNKKSKSGLAIFVHPSSAGFPQKWILRSKTKSMQNPVYPGQTPIAVSQTEPTVLRYRLLMHQGEMTVGELSASYDAYAAERGPSRGE